MKIKYFFIIFSFVSILIFSLDIFAIELKPNFVWPTPHGIPLDTHETYQSKAVDYLSPIQLGYGELSNTRNEFFDVIQNNAIRSLYFSRFQSYFQFGIFDQQGKCFILASHHIWSNSRLIKAQDISAPDFPQSLKVPPANLSTSNWEFLGPIPKLPEAIVLPGNCSSQKSNIDSIYIELKSGFMKTYDDNFVQVYNTYLKKFQAGDIHKRKNFYKFEIKHNLYFERNY